MPTINGASNAAPDDIVNAMAFIGPIQFGPRSKVLLTEPAVSNPWPEIEIDNNITTIVSLQLLYDAATANTAGVIEAKKNEQKEIRIDQNPALHNFYQLITQVSITQDNKYFPYCCEVNFTF